MGDRSGGDISIKVGVYTRRGFNTDGVTLFDASKHRFMAFGEKSNDD